MDGLAAATGIKAGLKWPNDVIVDDRKLAGILAEIARKQAIVVGIGLNVSLRPEEIGEPGATSLVELGIDQPDRTTLVRHLLEELGRRVSQWRNAEPDLKADYRDYSLSIGTLVRAILPGDRELLGTARSVDEQGRLHIETDDGQTVAVSARACPTPAGPALKGLYAAKRGSRPRSGVGV